MSSKDKNETEGTASRVESIIDAVWNDYESRVASAQKLIEERENAYLNTVSEVRKFLESNRKYVEELVKDTTEVNKAVVRGLISKVQTEKMKPTGEVQAQYENVVQKLEELAWTPWRMAVEFMNSVENRWEQGNREFINTLRDRRKLLTSVTDEWNASAKKYQYALFRAVGE